MIFSQNDLLNQVLDCASKLQIDCMIVGGAVRDCLIDRVVNDFDFLVNQKLENLVKRLATQLNCSVNYYPEFLTARVTLNADLQNSTMLSSLDFSEFRKEIYPHYGSLPIVSHGDLSSDLARRDFTINAMALPLSSYLDFKLGTLSIDQIRQQLIDQHSGLADLNAKLIRVLHSKSFLEDPTRIFRAIRYQKLISGILEEQTKCLLLEAQEQEVLKQVESYRIFNELLLIARSDYFLEIFRELIELNILGNDFKEAVVSRVNYAVITQNFNPNMNPEDRLVYLLGFFRDHFNLGLVLTTFGLKKRIIKRILQ